jgi:stress-induced morphogen
MPIERSLFEMLAPSTLEQLLLQAFPGARVKVVDLTGTQDHYEVSIVADQFRGVPKVKQHRMVYDALGDQMKGPIHALALKTSAD